MSYFGTIKSSRDYLVSISEGDEAEHSRFEKIGYTPTMTTADSDVWSGAGVYPFPTSAAQWKLVSVANDVGTKLFGNAEGANQTILCDATGNTTTLIDADVNFTSGTSVAIGDIVLLSPKGDSSTAALTPEWGYITDITNAATGTLVIGGGFSNGGSCNAARAYTIVDQSPSGKGALVVKIDYLTTLFAQKTLLVVCGGGSVALKDSTGSNLTDTYRVNSFRIVGMGPTGVSQGALQIQLVSDSTVINNITTAFTRARNSVYTVPAGKTLYVNQMIAGWALGAKATALDSCRLYLRATQEPATLFRTGTIFYPYAEVISNAATVGLTIPCPIKFISGVDIKISGIATAAGSSVATFRGWLEV